MKTVILLAIFVMVVSCVSPNKEKPDEKLNTNESIIPTNELYIQKNTYGGLGGYYEQKFHIKKGEHERLMTIDEGTDRQTFVHIDGKEELLKKFLQDAVATNQPKKAMSTSCVTGIDSEYIIKEGTTTLTLRPSEKCDSLFDLLISQNDATAFSPARH